MFLSHPANFWRLAWLSLAATLLVSATACKSDYPASGKAASADGKSQPRQVKTVKVAEMPVGEMVTVNGNLAAYDQTTVGMKVPGRLQTISVDLGSVVRKGQVIAQAEEQEITPRAEYDTVDSEYKVALSRYQDGLEEIRNRQGLLAQRRSELALAKQQLADTFVYSPLDGVVQEKKASAGEYLSAGAPVVSVVRIDPLRLRVDVPDRESHS